jgi:ubiquinone/menaquinone biosynthesis C-methylase UbiE
LIFKRLETKPLNLRPTIKYYALALGETEAKPDGMNVFDTMGVYWAEIADKNQTERQIQFLKNTLKADGYVLDLACGTGRHSIALSRKGYGMVGLDVSANLLKIAKQRSSAVELVRGDMRFLPFKPQAFAAALSMDTSLGYLPSERDDGQSLTEVRRVLGQDGVLVVDVFNRKKLTAKYQGKQVSPKWREYLSFFLLQKRVVSSNGDWLCDSWTVQDKADGQVRIFEHTVRLYDFRQLQDLLEIAQFSVQHICGDYEEQEFNVDSPRLIIVASAK